MSELIKLKDEKTGIVVKANKKGKFWNFTCDCGSEMWNNLSKKTKGQLNAKMPDLKCKNEDCDHSKGGYPFGMWLTDEHKDSLGLISSQSKSGDNSKKTTTTKKSNVNFNDFNEGIPVSMYSAWAKDMALYLAKETNINSWDDLMTLYGTCLRGVKSELDSFIQSISSGKEVTKDVSDEELEASVEDISEDVVEEKPEEKEEEDTLDLDDEDIDFNFDDIEI